MQRTRNKRRAPGGWLLVEATIGGVMCSVILAALLINVGAAMDSTTVSARHATAVQLAQQSIEIARAGAATLAAGTTTIAVPAGIAGTYTRSRVVTKGTTTVGAITMSFSDVTVTVTFPNHSGAKSVALSTRIYNP